MIIAGGGIIGLSCAWKLAGCKIPVRVFDSREPGGEASWAGAGMLAPGGEMQDESPLTRIALRSLLLYPEFVDTLREESGAEIDFRRCGAVELALSEQEAMELDARAKRQGTLGIHSEAIKYGRAEHARFYPDDAVVDPRQVVSALRKACVNRGVRILENEPVLEIDAHGAGVRTASGSYEDDGVLIAAGAWSAALTEPFRLPATEPVRGHLISYSVEPEMLRTILRHESTHLLQRSSGVLVAGSSTEHVGFDRTVDNKVVDAIRERASALLPELAGVEPAAKWTGFRPGVDGGIPVIGRVEGTAIWTAYGHYRNGILLAPDTAARIVESVVLRG